MTNQSKHIINFVPTVLKLGSVNAASSQDIIAFSYHNGLCSLRSPLHSEVIPYFSAGIRSGNIILLFGIESQLTYGSRRYVNFSLFPTSRGKK